MFYVSLFFLLGYFCILWVGKFYDKLDRLGDKVRAGLEDITSRNDIDTVITGVSSGFGIHFQKERPLNIRDVTRNDTKVANAYYRHMLARNIAYVSAALPHCFFAEPHTEGDVEEYLTATEDFYRDYKG